MLVFGEISFHFIQYRQNDVRANYVSGKQFSAERRFVKMTFGWMTIRDNDIRLNDDSEKFRSILWSFANCTIRPCDDSDKWLSAIFDVKTVRQNCISAKRRFDEMTVRENDMAPTFPRWYCVAIRANNLTIFFSNSLFDFKSIYFLSRGYCWNFKTPWIFVNFIPTFRHCFRFLYWISNRFFGKSVINHQFWCHQFWLFTMWKYVVLGTESTLLGTCFVKLLGIFQVDFIYPSGASSGTLATSMGSCSHSKEPIVRCWLIAAPYRYLTSKYIMDDSSMRGSTFGIYLLFSWEYRLEHCDTPPRMPFSTNRSMLALVRSSSWALVYFSIYRVYDFQKWLEAWNDWGDCRKSKYVCHNL